MPNSAVTFPAVAVPVICAPLFRPCVPESCLSDFSELKLADGDFRDRDISVDVLVGLDRYSLVCVDC